MRSFLPSSSVEVSFLHVHTDTLYINCELSVFRYISVLELHSSLRHYQHHSVFDQSLISIVSSSTHKALFRNKFRVSEWERGTDSQALYVQDWHLAVASLSDHLSAGGTIATMTGKGTWVGASSGAGLRAALFTLFTLLPSLYIHRHTQVTETLNKETDMRDMKEWWYTSVFSLLGSKVTAWHSRLQLWFPQVKVRPHARPQENGTRTWHGTGLTYINIYTGICSISVFTSSTTCLLFT